MVITHSNRRLILAIIGSILTASFLSFKASALSASAHLSCDATVMNTGEQTVCRVSVTTDTPLNFFSANISTELEVVGNRSISQSLSGESSDYNVISFIVKAPSSGDTRSITITDVAVTGASAGAFTPISPSNSVNLTSRSDDTILSSLSTSSGDFSPTFSPNNGVTAYTIQSVDSGTLTINAQPRSSSARVSGTGTKNLVCGWNDQNNFHITVTAENPSQTRTYTIKVYRNCSEDNSLKGINLSNGSIKFKPNTTSYSVSVGNSVSRFTATGLINDSRSSISYSPSQTMDLKVGHNTLYINVTAQNGKTRTYTLDIVRAGAAGKSSNSSLKSLTIDTGNINFNKNVYKYKTTVPYEQKTATVSAIAEDSKANVEISQIPELVVGENKSVITVTAENGAQTVYEITIIRQDQNAAKLDKDSSLSGLVVNDQEIIIDGKKTTYDITINNVIEKANIVAFATKSTSAAEIVSDGDTIGDKSTVRVVVTAEDGSTTTYVLNFSFPYETSSETVEEKKPINIILIIIIAVIALGLIGLLLYLYFRNKNKPSEQTTTDEMQTQIDALLNDTQQTSKQPLPPTTQKPPKNNNKLLE